MDNYGYWRRNTHGRSLTIRTLRRPSQSASHSRGRRANCHGLERVCAERSQRSEIRGRKSEVGGQRLSGKFSRPFRVSKPDAQARNRLNPGDKADSSLARRASMLVFGRELSGQPQKSAETSGGGGKLESLISALGRAGNFVLNLGRPDGQMPYSLRSGYPVFSADFQRRYTPFGKREPPGHTGKWLKLRQKARFWPHLAQIPRQWHARRSGTIGTGMGKVDRKCDEIQEIWALSCADPCRRP